jgi:alpha-2-macroglobulin
MNLKNFILLLFISMMVFSGCNSSNDEKNNVKLEKQYTLYDKLEFSKDDYDNRVEIELPYYSEGIELNKLVKVLDQSKNEIKISPYYKNGYVTISGDFEKDKKYTLIVNGTVLDDKMSNISYSYNSDFVFNSKELSINDIYANNSMKDLKSAHFILTFNSGTILTKDIRNYLTFYNNINYSYTIKRNKLYVYGNFKPNSQYFVTLKKGFEAGSSIVKSDLKFKISFSDMDSNVKFKDYKSYVSSYTEAIDIESTNIEALKVEIIKVNTENINYLNLFERSYLSDKYYQDERFFQNYGELVDSYKKVLPKEKNKTLNVQLDFTDKLKFKDDGIYLIIVKNVDSEYMSDSKLIFKSDLGISTKISKNQMFFSIRSLSTSNAISNAEIFVYSDKNKLIFKDYTNNNGILNKNFENVIKSKPKLVVVKKNKNINFLNLQNPISSYDILNDNTNIESNYDSLVFMERTLIRPNDSTNMLITVKDKKFKSLKNQKVYLQFIDPTQKELFTEELILNDSGISEYKFNSFNDYLTGKYSVNVLLGKTKIGYKEFYIEAFIPEKIEVNVNSMKDKYFKDESIVFDLNSKYLFGTPAKNLKYDIDVFAKESNYKSKNYEDYTYSNILKESRNIVLSNYKEEGQLDENGNKKFNIRLKYKNTSNSMLNTSLIGTVYDDGRAVRKFKEVYVYPYSNIVGLKKELTGNIKVNENLKINTILINPYDDAKIVDTRRLKVKVYKKYYHYYAGEEIREIESYYINSNDLISVKPKESGDYYVSVETEDGQISSEHFYVSGWDYSPVNIKDKSSYKISLKLNKEVYNSGDSISLDIKSPISGKLLLTYEEDEILDYEVYDLNSNNANIDLNLPTNIKKGVYIKAQIIRDTKSSNDILPFRVVGNTYLKKDNSDKKINVNIDTNNLYKSGDIVKILVNSDIKNSGYAVVSMVDKGILNIIGEKPIDAFKYYDRKNKDSVSLYDLYSDLQSISKLRAETVSGDGVESKRKKHMSPDSMNERVKPVSFWSKIIKLNNYGEGEVSFKLPNFNGELQIQSLVINENQIGSIDKKIKVKDDVIIKPTLPRFLIKSDDVIVPIRLLNTTDEVQNISLLIQSNSNLSVGEYRRKIILKPQDSILEEVNVKALGEGLSKLLIKVSNEKDSYINETSIYIKDKYDYKIETNYGVINSNEKVDIEIIDNETKLLDVNVKSYIGIDNSPFSIISKSSKYLIGYPHGCAEQTSSKLLAMLMSKEFIDKSDTKLLKNREIFINQGISKLMSMQNSNGMFTYWRGGNYVNNYASFYATFVLEMLKENGFEVPNNLLEKAQSIHWKQFTQNSNDLDFFIAFANKSDTNKIYDNNLYGNSLTSFVSLAAAMKKHNNITEYMSLIQRAKKYFNEYNMNRERSYSDSFYSPIKDISTALYLYTKFINSDRNDEFSSNMLRTVNDYVLKDNLYSTQDKAFAMLALSSYYKDIDFNNKNIDVFIKYENELKEIKNKVYEEIVSKNNNSITLINDGGVVNYTIDINKPFDLPVSDNSNRRYENIYIDTHILDQKGIEIDYKNINLGDKLYLKVEVSSNKRIENVSVNIQIPSGLEIINPRLYKSNNMKLENIDYNPDFEDYRDDRVLSYLTTNTGLSIYYIPLVATTKGKFIYPASFIEAMYDSRLNSYSKPSKELVIK